MLEPITLENSNVSAEIDAYFYHLLIGYDGVFKYGNKFAAEINNNNLIIIRDGLAINQGRLIRIVPGSYEEITIENGISGVNRTDLIVLHFETDGVTETHDIRVLKGEEGGALPEIKTGDTFTGATVNEITLYAVHIEGINISSVEKKFSFIISNKDRDNVVNSFLNDMNLFASNKGQELINKLNPDYESEEN